MIVGMLANMPAELVTRFKDVTADGGVVELIVWRVPLPVPSAPGAMASSA